MKRRALLGFLFLAAAHTTVAAKSAAHVAKSKAVSTLPIPPAEPLYALLPNLPHDMKDADATNVRHRQELADFLAEHRHVRSERIATLYKESLTAAFVKSDRAFMHRGEQLARTVLGLYIEDADTIHDRQYKKASSAAVNEAIEVARDHKALLAFFRKKYSDLDSADTLAAHGLLRVSIASSYGADKIISPPVKTDKPNVAVTKDNLNETLAGFVTDERARHDRIIHTCSVVMDKCRDMQFPLHTANGFVLTYAHVEHLFNKESQFDPLAQNPSGAAGLSQFEPKTWVDTLAQLPKMPYGAEMEAYAKPHWPEIEKARQLAGKASHAHPNLSKVLDKRTDVDASFPIFVSYIMDDGQRLVSTLGPKFKVTPGYMWLSNVVSSFRATSLIRSFEEGSHQLVNKLFYGKKQRLIPDPFITQNSDLFGSPKNPHTVGEVHERVNNPTPVAPMVLARELAPELIAKRVALMQIEVVNMKAKAPAAPTSAPKVAAIRSSSPA